MPKNKHGSASKSSDSSSSSEKEAGQRQLKEILKKYPRDLPMSEQMNLSEKEHAVYKRAEKIRAQQFAESEAAYKRDQERLKNEKKKSTVAGLMDLKLDEAKQQYDERQKKRQEQKTAKEAAKKALLDKKKQEKATRSVSTRAKVSPELSGKEIWKTAVASAFYNLSEADKQFYVAYLINRDKVEEKMKKYKPDAKAAKKKMLNEKWKTAETQAQKTEIMDAILKEGLVPEGKELLLDRLQESTGKDEAMNKWSAGIEMELNKIELIEKWKTAKTPVEKTQTIAKWLTLSETELNKIEDIEAKLRDPRAVGVNVVLGIPKGLSALLNAASLGIQSKVKPADARREIDSPVLQGVRVGLLGILKGLSSVPDFLSKAGTEGLSKVVGAPTPAQTGGVSSSSSSSSSETEDLLGWKKPAQDKSQQFLIEIREKIKNFNPEQKKVIQDFFMQLTEKNNPQELEKFYELRMNMDKTKFWDMLFKYVEKIAKEKAQQKEENAELILSLIKEDPDFSESAKRKTNFKGLFKQRYPSGSDSITATEASPSTTEDDDNNISRKQKSSTRQDWRKSQNLNEAKRKEIESAAGSDDSSLSSSGKWSTSSKIIKPTEKSATSTLNRSQTRELLNQAKEMEKKHGPAITTSSMSTLNRSKELPRSDLNKSTDSPRTPRTSVDTMTRPFSTSTSSKKEVVPPLNLKGAQAATQAKLYAANKPGPLSPPPLDRKGRHRSASEPYEAEMIKEIGKKAEQTMPQMKAPSVRPSLDRRPTEAALKTPEKKRPLLTRANTAVTTEKGKGNIFEQFRRKMSTKDLTSQNSGRLSFRGDNNSARGSKPTTPRDNPSPRGKDSSSVPRRNSGRRGT